MRKFKATPQKKLIGMAILFVLVPLFLLWYWVFFLGHKPGTDTMAIIACVAVLAAFLYLRYKKQLAKAQSMPAEGESLPEDDETESEEKGGKEAEFEEGGEEGAEEDEIEEAESEEAPEEEVEKKYKEEEKLVKAAAKKRKGEKR
ncbi:MAG: hypothetical protein WC634_05030 [archaeon]